MRRTLILTSFPNAATIRDYIFAYAEKNNVKKFVKTWRRVESVQFCDENETFTVRTEDVMDRTYTDEIFDHVIIANGHYTKPKIPFFPGEESFKGQIIHSHDFQTAKIYKGFGLFFVKILKFTDFDPK